MKFNTVPNPFLCREPIFVELLRDLFLYSVFRGREAEVGELVRAPLCQKVGRGECSKVGKHDGTEEAELWNIALLPRTDHLVSRCSQVKA